VLYSREFPYAPQVLESNNVRYVPESLGVYFATDISDSGIERLRFLPDDMMARDIVVRSGTAYVLAVGARV